MKKLSKLHHRLNVTKLLCIVAVATILSLLVIAIPASPASAAESIDLSPSTGEVGDKIDIDGSGFKTDRTRVYIYFSSQEWDVGDEIDDDVTVYKLVKKRTPDQLDGTLDTYFYVPEILDEGGDDPEDVVGGYYYVYVTYGDNDDIEAVEDFTVRGIELSPDEGTVDTEVEITGLGFTNSKDIRYIKYDGEEIDIESGDDETDRHGEFTSSILIPESIAGEHTIIVRDKSNKEASATFTVDPEITVTPISGTKGDTVAVTGTGFGDEEDVTIAFNDVTVATNTTDQDGSFTASFIVPDVAAAIYAVEAEDDDNNDAKAQFTVEIATILTISPVTTQASPAHAGMNIAVSGLGFRTSSAITVTDLTSGLLIATTTSNADGVFQTTFKAAGAAGEHVITASDGTSTLQVSFIMESQPPSAPALLLPEAATKVEAQVPLDWETVTDDSSPVTYTLQVATDDGFTPASILLEKKGLTKSEYTATEAEKLSSTKEEAPYYWRVKAIDAVSNESEWSTLGSFHVGFVFELTGWVLYTSMALAGLLLLFIGFLLGRGRRSAYG